MPVIAALGRLVLAMCALCLSQAALGQTTLTADWTSLGLGNYGAVSSGTVLPVGPNSVTVTTIALFA